MRLQTYIAKCGIASRRKAEVMIREGKVKVNGELVKIMGVKINENKDEIEVEGKIIRLCDGMRYYWLNKPMGYTSTTTAQDNDPIVTDLVPNDLRVYPVGRLDKDSHGLMLLTNDGELTHRLIHPKYHIAKTYEVWVEGKVTLNKLDKLSKGVKLDGEMTLPLTVEEIDAKGEQIKLRMVLYEGKYRQIRRMLPLVGLEVVDLERVGFGPIRLGNLELGKYKQANEDDIVILKKLVGLN